ncbi:MAG: addiction module protein, partial [Kangiellaceae bacterium]|nr:addiction module protein [Kangiellaceae bacterium]
EYRCTMSTAMDILKEAIQLDPNEKAKLVDQLITSLDKPDKDIDKLWAEEAESRLEAYQQGNLKAVSLEEVLSKYK